MSSRGGNESRGSPIGSSRLLEVIGQPSFSVVHLANTQDSMANRLAVTTIDFGDSTESVRIPRGHSP